MDIQYEKLIKDILIDIENLSLENISYYDKKIKQSLNLLFSIGENAYKKADEYDPYPYDWIIINRSYNDLNIMFEQKLKDNKFILGRNVPYREVENINIEDTSEVDIEKIKEIIYKQCDYINEIIQKRYNKNGRYIPFLLNNTNQYNLNFSLTKNDFLFIIHEIVEQLRFYHKNLFNSDYISEINFSYTSKIVDTILLIQEYGIIVIGKSCAIIISYYQCFEVLFKAFALKHTEWDLGPAIWSKYKEMYTNIERIYMQILKYLLKIPKLNSKEEYILFFILNEQVLKESIFTILLKNDEYFQNLYIQIM